MGLLYQFPVSKDETNYVTIDRLRRTVSIKSYGLPYIFWFYSLAIMAVLLLLALSIGGPLFKLYSYEDISAKAIALATFFVLGLSPLAIITPFFYQKVIISMPEKIQLIDYFFGLKLRSKKLIKESSSQLEVRHFLKSPNYARLNQTEFNQDFQNRGYFELVLNHCIIDRSSRKQDLIELQKLIQLPAQLP